MTDISEPIEDSPPRPLGRRLRRERAKPEEA